MGVTITECRIEVTPGERKKREAGRGQRKRQLYFFFPLVEKNRLRMETLIELGRGCMDGFPYVSLYALLPVQKYFII